jgi:hypothetical protein
MGAGRFAPDGFGTGDVTLHIVPPPLVNAAAALFQQIGDDQFSGWEDEWESFRRMYAEAGARGEAIIIA